jgi:hypothetical protein
MQVSLRGISGHDREIREGADQAYFLLLMRTWGEISGWMKAGVVHTMVGTLREETPPAEGEKSYQDRLDAGGRQCFIMTAGWRMLLARAIGPLPYEATHGP